MHNIILYCIYYIFCIFFIAFLYIFYWIVTNLCFPNFKIPFPKDSVHRHHFRRLDFDFDFQI